MQIKILINRKMIVHRKYVKYTLICVLVAGTLNSCKQKIKHTAQQDNSFLQTKLLDFTREMNRRVKKDSNNSQMIKEAKLDYLRQLRSIDVCKKWKGTVTMLDLDEAETFSSDTVIMRIGIHNSYGNGYQDNLAFLEILPIPKNGKMYQQLKRIYKNSEVEFDGRLINLQFNNITPGYEFNSFYILTDFSRIAPVAN